MQDPDRTASLMTPSKLAEVKPRAPATAAAWLDQMALDAGHAHVRRLGDLRRDLQAHAAGDDFSSLGSELARLGQALPQLDFGLLQSRGWWARATGKSRGAGSEFAAQLDRIEEALQALEAQNQVLRKKQQAAPDRALLELDVESRALDKIIDQGSRWLQDMRSQLKTRQAADADGTGRRQIEEDTARCELLVARLKVLRGVASAAQQARQQAKDTLARRAGLMQVLQHALGSDVKAWRASVSVAAAAGADRGSPPVNLDASMESHRDLQLCIKQAICDCAQLQADETALAEQLGALADHLHAAS